MISIPKDPPGARLAAFNLHKSIGITIFLLMVGRLTWQRHPSPAATAADAAMAGARGARQPPCVAMHACLLLMPIAGFTAARRFSGASDRAFRGARCRMFFARTTRFAQAFYAVHLTVSWVLVAAIAVHVAAASQTSVHRSRQPDASHGLVVARIVVADAAVAGIASPGRLTFHAVRRHRDAPRVAAATHAAPATCRSAAPGAMIALSAAMLPRRFTMSVPLSLTVNGAAVSEEVDPRTLLVEFIRNNLRSPERTSAATPGSAVRAPC